MKKIILFLMVALGLSAADLNVITDRSDVHLTEVINKFQESTGKKVEVTFVKEGIIEKAQSGVYDIMLVKDSSDIIAASRIGMLKPISKEITKRVPELYKDENGKWFIMSYRIRAFHVKNGMSNPPMTYEDLAKPEYKGKICDRSLTYNYNLEMFGTMITDMGTDKFTEWFKAFKDNLAKEPNGNDRNQVQSVFKGECDIALANTYYRGLMLDDPTQKAWAEATTMIIPDQGKNGKGAIALFAGLGSLTDNKLNNKLYEYLLSDEVQKGLSSNNHEYPIIKSATAPDVKEYGSSQNLNSDTIKLHKNIQNTLFENRVKAYKIVKAN